jgi:thymidylate synthase (FAD)
MSDEITFRSDSDVVEVDHMGGDLRICQAARVSTQGADSYESGESEGLINFLVKNRHGSPFEHGVLTWLITAPIFVWREFMRHRIASYNEESGRYKQLDPVFYIPSRDRPLVQTGKPGAYEFVPGNENQYNQLVQTFKTGALRQYEDYEYLLSLDIAREVARMELPLNIYSSAYVTMNVRALMNFLSLRTKSTKSHFPSFPQYEINRVADAMEANFTEHFPLVHAAFDNSGRIQP